MVQLVFLHQPYATMTSYGLFPVARVKWRPESFPCVAYIYAIEESKREADNPHELRQEYVNQKVFGNMPDTRELPVNQLIGKVVITGPTDIPGIYYIRDARKFIAPLDVPFEELPQWEDYIKQLNSKVFVPRVPHLVDDDSTLVVPLDTFSYELSKYSDKICIGLVGSFAKLVLDENGQLKPFTKFILWNANEGMTYLVDSNTGIRFEMTEDDSDLKRYPSLFSPDGTMFRSWLVLSTGYPLYD